MMQKKNLLISGVTLVEILIAIVIASIMMMALFVVHFFFGQWLMQRGVKGMKGERIRGG